jgi:tetratricopeptide (TPR) repeat protein
VVDYYRLFNSAAYLQRTGSYEASAAKWRQVLELSPADEAAHRNLGTVLLMTGHREESAAHFRTASELKLRATLQADPTSAAGFNDLGVLLVQTGRVEESVAQFEKAAGLKPDFAAARANLGGALVKLGRLDEALVQLRQALLSDPANAPAHYNLGLALSQRGDAPGAIREWRNTLELDPKYAAAHDRLGDAFYAQGRTAEALAHWRDSIQLLPNNAPTLRRAAWVLATSPDAAILNGVEALAFAVRAVEISGGNDARLLDTLAAAYAEKGQYANAALTARRARARASQEKQPALADEIAIRIALYESGQPFRDREAAADRR